MILKNNSEYILLIYHIFKIYSIIFKINILKNFNAMIDCSFLLFLFFQKNFPVLLANHRSDEASPTCPTNEKFKPIRIKNRMVSLTHI